MAKTRKQNIVEASHRLRIVQRDFADEDQSRQKQYLCEQLDQLLQGIPFGERKTFLEDLLERFPVGLSRVCDDGQAAPPAAPPRRLAADSPTQWVDALMEALPSLPEDERKAIIDQLRGIVGEPAPTPQVSTKSPAALRTTLQLAPDAQVHGERLGDLANLLADFVMKIEPLTASIWGKIAAKSSLRPPRQTHKLAGRFLSEQAGSPEELTKDLHLLLQFATAIMTAASRAGEEVASRYARRFSPEAIGALVDMEQKRPWDSLASSRNGRCWRKYCELAGELGAEYIEKEIESAMAEQVEAFVRGLEKLS
jgi:hypothetical protein